MNGGTKMAIKINESGTIKTAVADGISKISCKGAKGETYVSFDFTVKYYLVYTAYKYGTDYAIYFDATREAISSEQVDAFSPIVGSSGGTITVTYTNTKIKNNWAGHSKDTIYIAFGS